MKEEKNENEEGNEGNLILTGKKRNEHLEEINNKLREHILLRDSVERSMNEEFKKQLEHKDSIIKQLSQLVQEKKAGTETGALLQRITDLETLNRTLKESLSESTSQSELLSKVAELKGQLELLQDENNKLKANAPKEDPELVKKRAKELEEANMKLREHLLLRDAVERSLRQEFKTQISEKEEMIKRLTSLKEQTHEQGLKGIEQEITSELDKTREELQELRKSVQEKDSEVKRIAKFYKEKEAAYDRVTEQLEDQLKEKTFEINQLKAFVAERELLSQKAEEELIKQISQKDEQIRQLSPLRGHQTSSELENQLEQARQIIKIKDTASKKYQYELIKQREDRALLEKNLEAEKAQLERVKGQYEKIIAVIKLEHDKMLKSVISDQASREATAKEEAGILRTKLAQKEGELELQKKRIDEAIKEFNLRSQQMISIREVGVEPLSETTEENELKIRNREEMEEYTRQAKALRDALNRKEEDFNKKENELRQREDEIRGKEAEARSALTTVELRLRDLERQQDSIDTKEQILLKQQEALNKQIETKTETRLEPAKKESELESRITEEKTIPAIAQKIISLAKPEKRKEEPAPKPELAIEKKVPEIKPIEEKKPQTVGQVKAPAAEAIVQPKTTITPIAEKKNAGDVNLYEQSIGFHEVDEIISIIDVAINNKDTVEKIKNSLTASGYSKESIEKALRKMKLVA